MILCRGLIASFGGAPSAPPLPTFYHVSGKKARTALNMAGLELQGLKVRFTEAMFNHYGEDNLENGRRSTWVQEYNIYCGRPSISGP